MSRLSELVPRDISHYTSVKIRKVGEKNIIEYKPGAKQLKQDIKKLEEEIKEGKRIMISE